MKRLLIVVVLVFACFLPRAEACINLELNVGVVDSAEGRMLAEIISTIILERTGVKVGIHYFSSSEELDEAVSQKKIEIMVENTTNALRLLNLPVESDPQKSLEAAKAVYKRDKGLFWMKPFGFLKKDDANGPSLTASIVTKEVLDKFPGLPRVLGKLTVIDDATRAQLLAEAKDKKTRRVAKDFLIAKRFI
jgi:glycine betaine/choline ABC-type transport system substrate-binding protein